MKLAYTPLGINNIDQWYPLPVKKIFLISLNHEKIAIQISHPSVLIRPRVILQKIHQAFWRQHRNWRVLLRKFQQCKHSQVRVRVRNWIQWNWRPSSGPGSALLLFLPTSPVSSAFLSRHTPALTALCSMHVFSVGLYFHLLVWLLNLMGICTSDPF